MKRKPINKFVATSKKAVKFQVLKLTIISLAFLSFLSWGLFYILRVLITCYVRLFKNDFGKLLNPISTTLVDNLQSPDNSTVLFSLTIDGPLAIESVTKLFKANVLEATSKAGYSTKIRYPELQQYHESFMGHWFWKQDAFFSIANHIKKQTLQDKTSLNKLHEEFLNQPWKDKQSPWEIILAAGKIQSFLFLRVHHSLADGKSIIKLIVNGLGEKKVKDAEAFYQTTSFWKKTRNLLLAGADYIQTNLYLSLEVAPEGKVHPWNSKKTSENASKTWVALATPISMSEIKKITTKLNVSTSSVIMSILSGVISKDLPKRCGQFVAYAFPRPNHPEELTNHFYFGVFKLPLGKVDPLTRLQICDKVFNEFKQSQFPKYMEFIFEQAGVLPKHVKEMLMRHSSCLTPVRMTNMSVDREGIQIGQFQVSNVAATAGVCNGRGLRFMAAGYMDQLQLSVSANSSVFDDIQVQKFASQINAEFRALHAQTFL